MSRPICVIGTGFAGVTCMVGLAQMGWRVRGYDASPDRIARLRAGAVAYRDQNLVEKLRLHTGNDRITLCDSLEDAASRSEIVIITAGMSRDAGASDVSGLIEIVNALSEIRFETWPTVAVRSTVPPGTSDTLVPRVRDWGQLIYAPDFLREGTAIRDFFHPDRIIVGSDNCAEAVPYFQLFESLQRPLVFTTRVNAELIKCASNAFIALKIGFANEIANLCDALGATSDDVLRAVGYDRRIGPEYLSPGVGLGGPSFDREVKSIKDAAQERGIECELLAAALSVNESQHRHLVGALEKEVGDLRGLTVGVWGLTGRERAEVGRESQALRTVFEVSARGAATVVYDPTVRIVSLPDNSRLVGSALEAAQCDVLLVLSEWAEFTMVPPSAYAGLVKRGIVIDGCNVLDSSRVTAAGLLYRGVGRMRAVISDGPAFAAVVAV